MDRKGKQDAEFDAMLDELRRRHVTQKRREYMTAARELDGDHGNTSKKGARDDHEQK